MTGKHQMKGTRVGHEYRNDLDTPTGCWVVVRVRDVFLVAREGCGGGWDRDGRCRSLPAGFPRSLWLCDGGLRPGNSRSRVSRLVRRSGQGLDARVSSDARATRLYVTGFG